MDPDMPLWSRRACLCVAIVGLTSSAALSQKDGDTVGIGTYRVLRSAVLAEDRLLLVHVPEDYAQSTLRYPVLFHLYGQQVTHYFADAVMAADRLGSTAEAPPLIVVGVANTDRYRDNLPLQSDGKSPGGADAFIRFFAEELIPFIDANYRTKPYRLLAGPQAGGAFGLYALMTKPGLFNASFLRVENPFPGSNAFRQFYLDKATAFFDHTSRLEGFLRLSVDTSEPPETLAFAKRLGTIVDSTRPEGFRFELSVEAPSGDFVPLVGLAPALRLLFAGYKMPADRPPDSVSAIEDHYRSLSMRLGVELEPPELTLSFAADALITGGRLEAALELLTYQLRLHPSSLNGLWRLGETNRRLGNLAAARDAYVRFLAIRSDDAALVRNRLAEVERAIQEASKPAVQR